MLRYNVVMLVQFLDLGAFILNVYFGVHKNFHIECVDSIFTCDFAQIFSVVVFSLQVDESLIR